MELRHYYHLYADGDYHEIVREHFAALRSSGLGKELARLHIGMVGSEANLTEARRLLGQLIRRPFTTSEAPQGWEQETQDVLYADSASAQRPFLALYAHTKGAAGKLPVNPPWRKIMTRYTVTGWREAIAQLRGTVGAAGCFWAPFENGRVFDIAEGTQYFAGTFWWSRSEAIAKIGPPERRHRFDAESWIGKITRLDPPYSVACLFDAPLEIEHLSKYA